MHHRNVVHFAWTRPFARPTAPFRSIVSSSQFQAGRKLRHDEAEHVNERRRRMTVVQDEDQYLLKVVKNRLDNIINILKRAQAQSEAAASRSSKPTHRTHDGRNQDIPQYTATAGRQRADLPVVFSTAASKTVKAAEKLQAHLGDLQMEPYPNRSRSDLALWAAEMRQWSDERKHEELEELRLQEEADRKRLNENTRNLVTFMSELMAAGRSAQAAGLKSESTAVVFRELPKNGRKGGRRRPKFIRPKLSAANTESGKAPRKAAGETDVIPPKQLSHDTGGLLEMQSKLMSAIRGGSQR